MRLTQIQQLRDRGYRVDYPLTPTKVGKQFQTAEDLGARVALLYGDEWPQVKVKNAGHARRNLSRMRASHIAPIRRHPELERRRRRQ